MLNLEPKRLKIDNTIIFIDADYKGVQTFHQDALVILARILGWKIKHFMINIGSSTDILLNHCYEQIKHVLKPKLRPYDHELYGFNGKPIKPRGVIKLPLQFEDGDNYVPKDIKFLVVDY